MRLPAGSGTGINSKDYSFGLQSKQNKFVRNNIFLQSDLNWPAIRFKLHLSRMEYPLAY